ncbi:metallophosphoesterase [Streptomyces sp. NPDC059169]|uniref:metallophosphoesterase n=1 Tax=unclassified Streptomyces TaxID=2593676 RepID=UPI0036B3BF57
MLLVVLVVLAVLALLVGVHWYVWRRLVRDTTPGPGRPRRLGTAAVVLLPLLSVGALVAGRAGAPFRLQQVLAWPGYLWLATLLYLTLALLVGEAVRPILLRVTARRAAARSSSAREPEPLADAPAAAAPRPAEPSSGGGTPQPGTFAGGGASTAPPTADTGAATTMQQGGPADGTAPVSTAAVAARPAGTTAGDGTGTSVDAPPDGAVAAGVAPAGKTVSRRVFVSRIVGGAAAAAAVGTVGYGTYGVLRGPRVKRVTVPLAKLARSAHGFRIAVVSDIHLGPILGRAHSQRIVDTINSTQPDLVAVVGDLVDGSVADLGPAAEPLAQLTARHGAYFVTGNHEYFSGADAWVDHVRELGLTPLRNDRVALDGFDLAGVDDVAGVYEGQGPDFGKALGDRDRSRAAVLLAHQPVVIDDAVRHGVDLQLSGHTHGGQLWPGNYLADLANPTVAGLERYGDTQLYVSRGAGAWGPPVRVGAPSDITVVELASRRT